MPVYIEASEDLDGCYHSGTTNNARQTNKERQSYSANGPWTAETINKKKISLKKNITFSNAVGISGCGSGYGRSVVCSCTGGLGQNIQFIQKHLVLVWSTHYCQVKAIVLGVGKEKQRCHCALGKPWRGETDHLNVMVGSWLVIFYHANMCTHLYTQMFLNFHNSRCIGRQKVKVFARL